MATVVLAEDLKHGRQVAIKVLKPEVAAAIGHDRFLREIEIARPATAPDLRMTAPGTSLGTPLYMAPEQIAGSSDLDARADLYALGCVLYEMLAGQPPFSGPTLESLAYQHLSMEPRPLTDLRPDVPPCLVAGAGKARATGPP